MVDERTLLYRARALDQEALTMIHDRYYGSIYRYIAYRVSDVQNAEDLTSEVFTRLLHALRDRHAPQKTLRGWLYGVASRVVKEHYREKKRHNWSLLEDNIVNQSDNPVAQLENKLTHERLFTVMHDLTEDQQNVLALRFGFEMPIRDVAETMGKSEGSVKMLQARAIAAIADRLVQGGVMA